MLLCLSHAQKEDSPTLTVLTVIKMNHFFVYIQNALIFHNWWSSIEVNEWWYPYCVPNIWFQVGFLEPETRTRKSLETPMYNIVCELFLTTVYTNQNMVHLCLNLCECHATKMQIDIQTDCHVCLSVFPSVSISVSLYVSLHYYLSILSVPVCVSNCRPINLIPTCLPTFQFVCLPTCLPVRQLVWPPIRLSTIISVHP